MGYVIGIDGGTESLRAFVFDLEGRCAGSAAAAYGTDFPSPGQAEQSPDDWWSALGQSVQGALEAAAVAAKDVRALCVDTTCCSVVALDEAGAPLRPAMIWMDVRSAAEAADVTATKDPFLRVNGGGEGSVSAEWMIPKALWIKRHQPELYRRAARICEYQDYMNWRLTGKWVGSLDNMAVRWHYQADHGGLPRSLLGALDMAELIDKWPPEILAPGAVIGGLSALAAAHLGLPPDLPVVQGGADAFIAMIGLGVTRPGEMALITGSSHLHLGVAEAPLHKAGVWGTYMSAVYDGRPIIEGGQTSTGSVINWFKSKLATDTGYDALNAEAAALAPGSDGLLVLDHFQGNRTPYTDPLSRGAITGLSLGHGQAHIFRAIIESICLGTRLIVESFGDAFPLERIVLAGGATNSPLWLQLHADTLGIPIEVTEVPDAPGLGCAVLAATASGAYASIDAAAGAMVRAARTIEPDRAVQAQYAEVYARYCRLYHLLKDLRETAAQEVTP